MGEVLIVYELDKTATHVPQGAGQAVRRVHAAPSAPGTPTATGPRTLCGKDTFAMETSALKPAEHTGGPWYPEEYAAAVCPECDAVMEI